MNTFGIRLLRILWTKEIVKRFCNVKHAIQFSITKLICSQYFFINTFDKKSVSIWCIACNPKIKERFNLYVFCCGVWSQLNWYLIVIEETENCFGNNIFFGTVSNAFCFRWCFALILTNLLGFLFYVKQTDEFTYRSLKQRSNARHLNLN